MHAWMTIVDTVSHLLALAAAALNLAAAARNHRRRPLGLPCPGVELEPPQPVSRPTTRTTTS
jgi:hypothetical protein